MEIRERVHRLLKYCWNTSIVRWQLRLATRRIRPTAQDHLPVMPNSVIVTDSRNLAESKKGCQSVRVGQRQRNYQTWSLLPSDTVRVQIYLKCTTVSGWQKPDHPDSIDWLLFCVQRHTVYLFHNQDERFQNPESRIQIPSPKLWISSIQADCKQTSSQNHVKV